MKTVTEDLAQFLGDHKDETPQQQAQGLVMLFGLKPFYRWVVYRDLQPIFIEKVEERDVEAALEGRYRFNVWPDKGETVTLQRGFGSVWLDMDLA